MGGVCVKEKEAMVVGVGASWPAPAPHYRPVRRLDGPVSAGRGRDCTRRNAPGNGAADRYRPEASPALLPRRVASAAPRGHRESPSHDARLPRLAPPGRADGGGAAAWSVAPAPDADALRRLAWDSRIDCRFASTGGFRNFSVNR